MGQCNGIWLGKLTKLQNCITDHPIDKHKALRIWFLTNGLKRRRAKKKFLIYVCDWEGALSTSFKEFLRWCPLNAIIPHWIEVSKELKGRPRKWGNWEARPLLADHTAPRPAHSSLTRRVSKQEFYDFERYRFLKNVIPAELIKKIANEVRFLSLKSYIRFFWKCWHDTLMLVCRSAFVTLPL